MPRTRPHDQSDHRHGFTRRGLLAALGAGAIGASLPVAGRQEGDAWPLFQYNTGNTGHARGSEGPRDAAGARWGYLDGDSFRSTPVVTGDAVYAADARANEVVSVRRGDGGERWRVEANVGDVRMTAADGTLFVPADDLEARSQADGSVEWTTSIGDPMGVAIQGNHAYVAARAGAYRVTLGSGEVDWHNDRVTQLQPALAVNDDYVYGVGKQYGNVIALDPATGSRSWLRRIDSSATGEPTAAGNRVVVPVESELVALSYESGLERWRYEAVVRSSVAVADGVVFGTAEGEDVFALDLGTGDEQWRTAVAPGSNSPVVAGGLLYVTGSDGSVAALDPSDGTVAWQATVGGERNAGVAVGGGELYVADGEGQLAALAAGANGGLDESTPESTPTPEPAATDESAGGADETPTSTGAPGFGLLAGVAATGAGAVAALGRRSRDGGD